MGVQLLSEQRLLEITNSSEIYMTVQRRILYLINLLYLRD